MAEPLKARSGLEIPQRIAAMIERVHPVFASRAFVEQALRGYADLELMPRACHIARALDDHLPADDPCALDVVRRSVAKHLNDLGRADPVRLRKRLSLRQMTTRTQHPGLHRLEALVNGAVLPLGTFEVRAAVSGD